MIKTAESFLTESDGYKWRTASTGNSNNPYLHDSNETVVKGQRKGMQRIFKNSDTETVTEKDVVLSCWAAMKMKF